MKTPINIGRNLDATVEGTRLTIVIDLAKNLGDSKSGKNVLIASTNGNKSLPSGESIGVNVYRSK